MSEAFPTMQAAVVTYTPAQVAMNLARAGFPVFPCGADKKPLTVHGFKDASIDLGTVSAFWRAHPRALAGVPTGAASGLFVVDLDTDRETGEAIGEASLAALGFADLICTVPTVATPSGGRHLYFRDCSLGNTTGKLGRKIDTRGNGGYVIAPGSVAPAGAYRLMNGQLTPESLTSVPDALLERLTGHTAPDAPQRAMFNIGSEFPDTPSALLAANKSATSFHINSGVVARKTSDDYTDILRRARTDGEKHAGVRDLAASLAGAGVPRAMAESIVREACPVWDAGVVKTIASAYAKFGPSVATQKAKGPSRAKWCADIACTILETDPAWAGVLAYDEFAGLYLLLKPIPGTKAPRATFTPRPMADTDTTAAVRWFNRNGFPDATKNGTADAIELVAMQAIISPVRHFLQGLTWDGKPRVADWLTRYCGADPLPLTAKVGQAWLVSAVARALQPGCKADCALVLEGKQGAGKSSILRALGGDWFHDGLSNLHDKDASAGLRGKWIIELPELSAMRRSDTEAVKAFLSRTEERYRPAYGRAEVIEPRRCVFAGTTNRADYLTDDTGGRRFWPVVVGAVDLAELVRDRDQIWAEAVALFQGGAHWWLDRQDEGAAAAVIATRAADDPWTADVLRVVDGLSEVSTRDVFQLLDIALERRSKPDTMRIAGILTRAGWANGGRYTGGASRGITRFLPPQQMSNGE